MEALYLGDLWVAQPPSKAGARHFDPSEAIWHVSQKISPAVPV